MELSCLPFILFFPPDVISCLFLHKVCIAPPHQCHSWQTLPDYNWLSFAITQTTLLERQLRIRITVPKIATIKNLPVVMEGKQSFALTNQTKHIRCNFFGRHNEAQY